MPFTFAHPAIILPFGLAKRPWFSMTGLIVGSMSPDFEYFFRMRIYGSFSHSLPGVFLFCLPASLLVALVCHVFVRDALIDNLPPFIASRFQTFRQTNWFGFFKSHFVIVAVSVIIGTFSHLFWDAFTHYNGYFIKHFPALLYMEIYDFPLYNILQHASSFVGLLIITIVVFSLPKSNVTFYPKSALLYWLIAVVCAATILAIYVIFQQYQNSFGNVLVASISSFTIGILMASVCYKFSLIRF